MKNLINDFYNRATEWFFRVRTLAAWLLSSGVVLLVAVMSIDLAGQLSYRSGDTTFDFQLGTGAAMPEWLLLLVVSVAVLMIVAGGILLLRDERRERRRLMVVVEVRGLHSSPDTPAKDLVKPAFRGQRHSIVVDFRPSQSSELLNPNLMLEKIKGMWLNVGSAVEGRDLSDVVTAVGGLAAVPAMFLVGARFEDESKVELFDWNRDLNSWKMIDGLDSGNRPKPLQTPSVIDSQYEVVLAVSASYPVDDAAIAATFPDLQVFRLVAEKVQANGYWSEAEQRAFSVEFRHTVEQLLAQQVKRIHLVLAAPAALAVRMGTFYDERLHPELIVYQYERSSTPPYPWGILMPHHGTSEPSIYRVTPTTA